MASIVAPRNAGDRALRIAPGSQAPSEVRPAHVNFDSQSPVWTTRTSGHRHGRGTMHPDRTEVAADPPI